MPVLNLQTIDAAFINWNTSFQKAVKRVAPKYSQVAMIIPSSTAENKYPWLDFTTKFNEWLNDRIIQTPSLNAFTIVNRHFENTVGIDRDVLSDDVIGAFSPLFERLGEDAAAFPDRLVFPLLKNGFTNLCYDGQPFFSAAHASWDVNRNPITVANMDNTGSGSWWYLLATGGAVKPLVYQQREPYEFVLLNRPTDINNFREKNILCGVDGRSNAGYGPWWLAYASNQPPDSTHYGNARAFFGSLYTPAGDPMEIEPDLLVHPPELEGQVKTTLEALMVTATTNIWAGTAKSLKTAWIK